MTDRGEDKVKHGAQVELCHLPTASQNGLLYPENEDTGMCRNSGRYSSGDIALRRRNQDDLNQQRRLCENFNTDVLTPRNDVTPTVQSPVVMKVDIRRTNRVLKFGIIK